MSASRNMTSTLTPSHHQPDTTVHRGAITKQGSRLVRWAAIESVKVLPDTSHGNVSIRRQLVRSIRGGSCDRLRC